MKHAIRIVLALVLAILGCTACQPGRQQSATAEPGDTICLRYARNLVMVQHDGYLEATMRNPWDSTQMLHRYIIRQTEDSASALPAEAAGATIVCAPLRRAAVFTSVHCALLQELGCPDAIGGICELEYIHLPFVHEGVACGRIANLGNGMSPDLERVIQLQPDALLPTPFENSGGYGRLTRLGIPIVECADYMERSPLGRAEWIRFYGRLFGRAREADSLFESIERRYLDLRRLAETASTRPRLICEVPKSGYWYLPGGESTMGQLYRDAGADYLFSDLRGAGSVAMSIERVLDRAMTADVWIMKNNGVLTRRQIVADCPTLRPIDAQMWFCDIGSNNYYEETPFHPERLLEDIISLLHPELGLHPEKSYFRPME